MGSVALGRRDYFTEIAGRNGILADARLGFADRSCYPKSFYLRHFAVIDWRRQVQPKHSDKQSSWHLGEPFWRSNRVFGESLFFIREGPDVPPRARLLFPPAGPLLLTSASRETQFTSPDDYLVDVESGI